MRNNIHHLFIQAFDTRLTSFSYVRLCTMSTLPKPSDNNREAFLRFQQANETFSFKFRYINEDNTLRKELTFCRKLTEPVNRLLCKINARITTETGKATQKRLRQFLKKNKMSTLEFSNKSENIKEVDIALYDGNTKVEGKVVWEHLLNEYKDLKLVISENTYHIRVNIPLILKLTLNPVIMVGYSTYPDKFITDAVDETMSIFTWYRLEGEKCDKEHIVGNSYRYTPEAADKGCFLKFTCVPKNKEHTGIMHSITSTTPVVSGPACPFENRHKLTMTKCSKNSTFRITSYNILADTYASTQYSQEVLFNYCPPDALSMNYRKQLILKELLGYKSDIICLQEVDDSIFQNDLLPILSDHGYNGRHAVRNSQRQGLAIFYQDERFYVTASETVVIKDSITNITKFYDVWKSIDNDKLKERFLGRNTTIQVIALVPLASPNVILLIANTHLYFHPDADHIRLLQGYYILEYLRYYSDKMRQEYPLNRINVMLCGDFNSTPDCGLYRLITTKHAPKDLPDWKSNLEESTEDIQLHHDLDMKSACGTPLYTNYTPNFTGCLDYIFYETNSFTVERVIDMPSHEEVSKHSGLPNIEFPSDHIALCADLQWVSSNPLTNVS